MKENEQIIEATGWHVWSNGDGTKKVDRCIRLGQEWHYHVIEDEEGDPADEWSADYEQLGTDPLIFPTKDLADKEEERQTKEYRKSREDREAEEDAEDAPLVEKLASLSPDRLQRVVEKTESGYVAVWGSYKRQWERTDRALDLVRYGYITHTVKNKKTVIPLGSIDHVTIEDGYTRVTTKSGDFFLYEGKEKYEAVSEAITFSNMKFPF